MSARLLISTRKGLFFAQPDEDGYELIHTSFLGDNVTLALHDCRDGALYAALSLGHFGVKLHRSDDGGESWAACQTPVYPEPPTDKPDLDPMKQTPIPYSTQLIRALESGGDHEPGVLWCGTVPGGLFRSPDRGMTWEMNRPLWDDPRRRQWFGGGLDYAGIHSICVDPRDAKNIAVGVSCGGVWITENAGKSWEVRGQGMKAVYMPPEQAENPAIQDPHRLVQCRADPETLWVQHHNGIFHSTDRGRQWNMLTNVKPSDFGFAVAVHPKEPKTAWFIPAQKAESRVPVEGKVVVNRTSDGGQSFSTLTDGLPQHHAFDIVYRHALDVASDGKRLAFGSTTGSLWTSLDGGDSWQEMSHHLPPINAVRFWC